MGCPPRPSNPDEHNALAMAMAFAGHARCPPPRWLRAEARELVIRHRATIVRVADALERSHVLTGEQVAAFI